jgi:glucosamine-6-phosphate isomerase
VTSKNEIAMKIIVSENYEALSAKVADDLIALLQPVKSPVVCTASGDTPAGVYKVLVEKVSQQKADVGNWLFVGLDEWVGMNGNDEGSCRFHLNNQLFHPLKVAGDKICFFDGRADDLQRECKMVDDFINESGGLDVAIVGIGMNGHIGMNEPGTPADLHSHVVILDPVTQQVGQKYFKTEQHLTKGITLGLASLMQARYIFLLVSGKHKAEIVKRMLEGKISEQLPATILKSHPHLYIYLDADAASLIDKHLYE